ncbi:biopolymer transporter TonB [Sesbania bispinosa]|nr:biopolymer transporter TonB [Sesbania bispinosa]
MHVVIPVISNLSAFLSRRSPLLFRRSPNAAAPLQAATASSHPRIEAHRCPLEQSCTIISAILLLHNCTPAALLKKAQPSPLFFGHPSWPHFSIAAKV